MYATASGQLVNYEKSVITFNDTTPLASRELIKRLHNMTVCEGHQIYLGLPTFSLRSKRLQFGYLPDRVAKKVDTSSE